MNSKPSRNDLIRIINKLQNENLALQQRYSEREVVMREMMLQIITMKDLANKAGFEFNFNDNGQETRTDL